jgi:metal transporter CNNM
MEDDPLLENHDESTESRIYYAIAAGTCVTIAAMAAGLTVGMLGLDPLVLLVKQRASVDPMERQRATQLLPVIKQHHRLLVTLLLMNSIANEALPIFLEKLVPSSVAILLSVTLVLFFGEIIPSAIFTGPDQIKMAYNLLPLVRVAMCCLYPLAAPLAKILDMVLHDEDPNFVSRPKNGTKNNGTDDDDEQNVESINSSADHHGTTYHRGELSALIRIQYEERLAQKRKRKIQLMETLPKVPERIEPYPIGSNKLAEKRKNQNAAAIKLDRAIAGLMVADESPQKETMTVADFKRLANTNLSDSIHEDEVTIVEGALQMKTKVALDVFTPLRQTFCIPSDLVLDEENIVRIYSSGFSRIPVFQHPSPSATLTTIATDIPKTPGSATSAAIKMDKKLKRHICGVLITRQLIVVDASQKRPLATLPLYVPQCVSPNTTLVDLLNLFQTGGRAMKGGHMALVCARPHLANEYLSRGDCVPDDAGVMGVITLEDVFEALLQEEIYDEMDRLDKRTHLLELKVWNHWRNYIAEKNHRKAHGANSEVVPEAENKHQNLFSVIQNVMLRAQMGAPNKQNTSTTETTALLQK